MSTELYLRIDIQDILRSDIPTILGCTTRNLSSAPLQNLPQGIHRLEILEDPSGVMLYNGPLPPVTELPARHVVWCPLPNPIPSRVRLSLIRNQIRILTSDLKVPAPLLPVACFRNHACSYANGLRVGSMEGFSSYSIRLDHNKYIQVSNGRIKDVDAVVPFGNYPVLSTSGTFFSLA